MRRGVTVNRPRQDLTSWLEDPNHLGEVVTGGEPRRSPAPNRRPPHIEVELFDAPGGRGTEVWVTAPAASSPTPLQWLATVTGQHPDQQLRRGLRRMKQQLEAGEPVEVSRLPAARGPLQRALTRLMVRGLRRGGHP
jgi:hypothetical protein